MGEFFSVSFKDEAMLKDENKQLNHEVKQLKAKNKQMNDENKHLKDTNKDLNAEVKQLKDTNKDLKDKIEEEKKNDQEEQIIAKFPNTVGRQLHNLFFRDPTKDMPIPNEPAALWRSLGPLTLREIA